MDVLSRWARTGGRAWRGITGESARGSGRRSTRGSARASANESGRGSAQGFTGERGKGSARGMGRGIPKGSTRERGKGLAGGSTDESGRGITGERGKGLGRGSTRGLGEAPPQRGTRWSIDIFHKVRVHISGFSGVSTYRSTCMRRRSHHTPHRENPQEQRLRELVGSLVADESEKAAYVASAHELMMAERRSERRGRPEFRCQRPECRARSGALTTDKRGCTQIGTAAVRARPFPDYSRRTRRSRPPASTNAMDWNDWLRESVLPPRRCSSVSNSRRRGQRRPERHLQASARATLRPDAAGTRQLAAVCSTPHDSRRREEPTEEVLSGPGMLRVFLWHPVGDSEPPVVSPILRVRRCRTGLYPG